ncbi:O-glucosyltransferase rumi homolog [Striga asiatica]|uniref:O-glucosyltransferase rumi homolog n=1 Tax=Striga asiatica TaxID=4170 RepID=A0A5A7R9A7_STRAF|nr:O-glucosyltransferase rumi homolog [Striga asiatica]
MGPPLAWRQHWGTFLAWPQGIASWRLIRIKRYYRYKKQNAKVKMELKFSHNFHKMRKMTRRQNLKLPWLKLNRRIGKLKHEADLNLLVIVKLQPRVISFEENA